MSLEKLQIPSTCSVPMWVNGIPAGTCGKPAFGEPLPRSRYTGYVPGLACKRHGGPACPGIEIEPGKYSGCVGGIDCPVCEGAA